MVKRKYTSMRLVKPGMVIDQTIADATGRVLVARKAVLDEYMIEALRKMSVTAIYIAEGNPDPIKPDDPLMQASLDTLEKIDKLTVPDRAKVELSESVKKRVNEGMRYIFNNPDADGFQETANTISNDLMQAITENDALAINVDALKISDEYTFKHSVDVASMAMLLLKNQGFPKEDVYEIGVAGLLHDLGKSKIPKEILNKPGRLTDEEFEIMKKHPVYGYQILKEKGEVSEQILLGVLQHHEKKNGKGYPMKLSGDRIHYFGRVLSVVDVYDALVTERPYKSAFSPRDAVEMILAMTEDMDMGVIQGFLHSIILYPVNTTVLLSTGEHARVVENIPGYPMRPKVVGIRTGKVYDLANDVKCANIIVE